MALSIVSSTPSRIVPPFYRPKNLISTGMASPIISYPVGQRVGSVRNNDPALLDPLVLAA